MLILVLFAGMHLTGSGVAIAGGVASSDALGRSRTPRGQHETAGNPLPESAKDRESI